MNMILLDPHLTLFIVSYMVLEIAISSTLYGGTPKANTPFKVLRVVVTIFLATGLSSLVMYNPIKYRHILTLILLILSWYISILSIYVLDENMGNRMLLSSIISFIFGFLIGVYAFLLGIIVFIAMHIRRKEVKLLNTDVAEKIWKKVDRISLQYLIAIADFVFSVLMYHGLTFF